MSQRAIHLSHALRQAASTPYTNRNILETPDRGSYIVVDVAPGSSATKISVSPDTQVAVKDQGLQRALSESYGSWVENRSDIQSGKADLKGRRLLTVGGLVRLTDDGGNTAYPMHIRNPGMPLAHALTNPSGLASETPHKALWHRINDEAGYCYLDKETKTLNVIIIQPDEETRQAYPRLAEEIGINKMKNQRHIRQAVAAKTGIAGVADIEDWNIALVRLDAKLDHGPIEHVELGGILEGHDPIPACVHNDAARQTITLTVPLTLKTPVPLTELVLVDPEGFGRCTRMLSGEDLCLNHATVMTPALTDMVEKLTGAVSAKPQAVSALAKALAPSA